MSRILGLFSAKTASADPGRLASIDARLNVVQPGTGPDLIAERAQLGWRGGADPQSAQRGQIAVVLDGAIYNPEELETPEGVDPADLNDAERFLAHFRRHGFEATMQTLNADIAVALHDGDANVLWLGRDKVGVRPLYYAEGSDTFGFASVASPLRALAGVDAGVNQRFAAIFAGAHYRYFDNVPNESAYAGVKQLPAGHYLRVDGAGCRLQRYWGVLDTTPFVESEAVLAERYRELLIDSVRRRLARHKNPAFTLSGGLDSSSVLSCAVHVTGAKQTAFSSTYEDHVFDERDDIATILDTVTDDWRAVPVDEFDLLDTVGEMVRVNDEPVATATWLAHYLLCQQVGSEGFSTLFGGLGGDELNAGEYEHFFFHFADLRRAGDMTGDMSTLWHEVDRWAGHHDHPLHRKSRDAAMRMLERVVDPARPGVVLSEVDRMTQYYTAIDRRFYDLDLFTAEHDHPSDSWLVNRTYQDLRRETTPCCLRAEDRQTRAFGLSNCDPFLDHRLVEFMFRVPGDMKIRDGITKRLLREAMKGILVEETRNRIAKTGWNAPADRWFARGRNADNVRDLISSQWFRELGLYHVPTVKRMLDDHTRIVTTEAREQNHMMFFWQLVNAALWLRNADAA